MKKLNLLTVLIMLAFASVSFAQIAGSAHDFSNSVIFTWNASGEICITCHTPHDASIEPDSPLWNHELSVASYTTYNSSTLDATPAGVALDDPDGSSKLCLSCHDGTVALDNFGGTTTGTNMITGADLIGTDISDDHPISFDYNTALSTADGELKDPSSTPEVAGLLLGGKMQCSSCHDVHNAGFANLLVKENSASALCLTCHIK